jgi:hypothetical protein
MMLKNHPEYYERCTTEGRWPIVYLAVNTEQLEVLVAPVGTPDNPRWGWVGGQVAYWDKSEEAALDMALNGLPGWAYTEPTPAQCEAYTETPLGESYEYDPPEAV